MNKFSLVWHAIFKIFHKQALAEFHLKHFSFLFFYLQKNLGEFYNFGATKTSFQHSTTKIFRMQPKSRHKISLNKSLTQQKTQVLITKCFSSLTYFYFLSSHTINPIAISPSLQLKSSFRHNIHRRRWKFLILARSVILL